MINENYMKQCEMAEEVQKGHIYIEGDYVYARNDRMKCGAKYDKDVCPYILVNNTDVDAEFIEDFNMKNPYNRQYFADDDIFVWLPTLEQLFEMTVNHGHHGYDIGGILFHIKIFVDDNKLNEYTIKEVVLMWVMQEKYHKSWTGEKWEAIK